MTVYLNETSLGEAVVEDGVSKIAAHVWAKALGFKLGWNNATQTVTLDGRIVPHQVTMREGRAFLPVRLLAKFSGLTLTIKNGNIVITK
jgi:hypothetical protein